MKLALLLIFFNLANFRIANAQDWISTSIPVAKTESVTFVVDLAKKQSDWLEKTINDISDPESINYQRYLTNEDIAENIGRTNEEIKAITKQFSNLCSYLCPMHAKTLVHKDYIEFKTCVARFECMFHSQLFYYKNPFRENFMVHIDKNNPIILDHILKQQGFSHSIRSIITGIDKIGHPAPPLRSTLIKTESASSERVDPLIAQSVYGTKSFSSKGLPKNNSQASQCTVDIEINYIPGEIITNFQNEFKLPVNPIDFIVVESSYFNSSGWETETLLDTEYISSITDLPTCGYLDGNNINFVTFVSYMMNRANAAKVVSFSYCNFENLWSPYLMDQANSEFQKLGIAGFTVLFAAGDAGTGNTAATGCNGVFSPEFPASSPYVAAVGATYLSTDLKNQHPWSNGGGGFSTHFKRPSWQNDAVSKYLESTPNLPDSSLFNSSGRGYPDLVGFGQNVLMLTQTGWEAVGGTSAATPMASSVISAFNAERLRLNKPPIGFFLPALYKLNGGLGYDVTSGNNYQFSGDGFYGSNTICRNGFPAASGWDASSGWGSPNLEALLKIF